MKEIKPNGLGEKVGSACRGRVEKQEMLGRKENRKTKIKLMLYANFHLATIHLQPNWDPFVILMFCKAAFKLDLTVGQSQIGIISVFNQSINQCSL